MTAQPLSKEVDPNPLVSALVEKTAAGRLEWQTTAAEGAYAVRIGGNTTLKLTLEGDIDLDAWGNPESVQVPVLSLLNEQGQRQWEILSSQVDGGLWPLYKLAQRVANKVHEKMAALVEEVQKL